MLWIRRLNALALIGLGLLPRLALGSPEDATVRFEWTAPAGCPDTAAVQQRIAGLQERGPSADIRVTATISALAHDQWRLDLELHHFDGKESRTIVADDCETLADTAALLVAAASDHESSTGDAASGELIDDAKSEREGDPREAATEAPSSADEAAPREREADVQARELGASSSRRLSRPRSRLRAAARSEGLAGYGVLPGGDFGAGLALGLSTQKARFELGANYLAPRTARYEAHPEVGGRFSFAAAVVRGCPVWHVRQFEFPVCFGLEAGAVFGTGVGVDRILKPRGAWTAASLRPAVVWAPSRWIAVALHVEGVVPFVRRSFAVADLGSLHRPTPVAVRGGASLEARFP